MVDRRVRTIRNRLREGRHRAIVPVTGIAPVRPIVVRMVDPRVRGIRNRPREVLHREIVPVTAIALVRPIAVRTVDHRARGIRNRPREVRHRAIVPVMAIGVARQVLGRMVNAVTRVGGVLREATASPGRAVIARRFGQIAVRNAAPRDAPTVPVTSLATSLASPRLSRPPIQNCSSLRTPRLPQRCLRLPLPRLPSRRNATASEQLPKSPPRWPPKSPRQLFRQ
jgi:hypothetical protein